MLHTILQVELDTVTWLFVLYWHSRNQVVAFGELSGMVKIRRPKSNLILNTITPPPHSSRLHKQAHTHRWLCEVICAKQVFIYCHLLSVPWIPVSFLIIVLFIFCSGFLESSLPKHWCGSLLLFSFFLAQTNQQSFPRVCFEKHIQLL